MTLNLANGKTYQIPLVGKYGKFEGPRNPSRLFEVSLIPHQGSKAAKTFRIRGVVEATTSLTTRTTSHLKYSARPSSWRGPWLPQ